LFKAYEFKVKFIPITMLIWNGLKTQHNAIS
jgi:hypothetical protein